MNNLQYSLLFYCCNDGNFMLIFLHYFKFCVNILYIDLLFEFLIFSSALKGSPSHKIIEPSGNPILRYFYTHEVTHCKQSLMINIKKQTNTSVDLRF